MTLLLVAVVIAHAITAAPHRSRGLQRDRRDALSARDELGLAITVRPHGVLFLAHLEAQRGQAPGESRGKCTLLVTAGNHRARPEPRPGLVHRAGQRFDVAHGSGSIDVPEQPLLIGRETRPRGARRDAQQQDTDEGPQP